MGNLDMFYPRKSAPSDPEVARDRFLAATVAFGHPGFLLHGREGELRSYYMVQALASRYTQVAADTIRYADADGALHETTAALANGAYMRSQVTTRYADGTVTVANGHPEARMKVTVADQSLDLPPNGYWGRSGDGTVRVFSGEVNGRRADLAVAPAYTYIDGRGHFTRFDEGAAAGVAICRALTNGMAEILMHKCTEVGFPYAFSDVVALDATNGVLGTADVRTARGLSFVQPVKGAFSYRARRGASAPTAALTCARACVKPGERVVIKGTAEHAVTIPADARPGARLWFEREGAWIDFTVENPPPPPAPAVKKGRPLPSLYARGMALRGQAERELDSTTGAEIYATSSTCGGVTKPRGLFMHPPYKGGTGYAFARYTLTLPTAPMQIRCAVGKQDGSDLGDGLLFKIAVEDTEGRRHEIAQCHVATHAWHTLEGSLAPWAGQTVSLLLITDVGDKNNSSGDWGAWAEMELTQIER